MDLVSPVLSLFHKNVAFVWFRNRQVSYYFCFIFLWHRKCFIFTLASPIFLAVQRWQLLLLWVLKCENKLNKVHNCFCYSTEIVAAAAKCNSFLLWTIFLQLCLCCLLMQAWNFYFSFQNNFKIIFWSVLI